MSALQQEQYTILGRAPFTLGSFSLASYKAREGASAAVGATAARIVLLRRLALATDSTGNLIEASQISSSLPTDQHILRHFGLVTVSDIPSDETDLEPGVYAVSEWVQGITLSERIRRVAPFSLSAALNTAIEIIQALNKAKSVGVEHGNLTSDEIFITSDGIAKVADFALGRAALQSAGSPRSSVPADSLSACAAMLYEMLTGKSASEFAAPLAPRQFVSNIPNAVDGITQKASLGAAPEGYSGLTAMLADLQAAREALRLGQSLDWSPFDKASAGSSGRPRSFKPMPAASPAGLQDGPAIPSGLIQGPDALTQSQPMPTTPRTEEQAPGSQQIPAARIDNPAGIERGTTADYDDYEPPRSRASSILRAIFIVLGSIAIVAIVFACVYFALLVSNVPSDITVPSLIGKQFTDSKNTAAQQHFSLKEIGHSNSDTWPQGAIYQQTPVAGRMIKSGKDVEVFVSDGPRLIDVPDLSQTTQSKAQAVLQDAGLPLGSIDAEYDNNVPKGIVTSQQPVAGAKVARDQAINLIVSKGPPPPTAPTNLSATCTLNGEIDLSWDQVPIATAYDIYRDGKKIQTGFPETEYSDVGLDTDQTHVYTVTAVDSNGESPASLPASALAQPGNLTNAPDTASAPDDGSQTAQPGDQDTTVPPAPVPSQGAPKQRQFEVKFRVPRGKSYTRNVQIQVQDATGTNVAYNQDLSRGDIVDQQVQGFGNRIILRIFIDGKLVKQDTK